ncbi:DNA glycosylase [Gorgonomyces haynaldii]|nr:DNA glycosylase [Gorgonomyces haynaldii]
MAKPKDWQKVYTRIEEYRKANQAPVDTVGCERLADNMDPKVFRFQALVALMLSSQTKDPVTADAVERLKQTKNGLTVDSILEMDIKELDQCIQKVGFHNRKTTYLKKTALILKEQYDGDIPAELDDMLKLPGVGPKMAHLCMQVAWDKTLGIGVDTHVHRISNRLGWVKTKDPEQTRKALEEWLPTEYWRHINVMLVGFGQVQCLPVKPLCQDCPVKDLCPKVGTKSKNL